VGGGRGREKQYDEERYFTELLDYLRRQAEELPRELRLRLVRKLSVELGLPAVEAKRLEEAVEAERPPERPRKKVVIDLALIEKYPLLPEAKKIAQAFSFDELDEAAKVDHLIALKIVMPFPREALCGLFDTEGGPTFRGDGQLVFSNTNLEIVMLVKQLLKTIKLDFLITPERREGIIRSPTNKKTTESSNQ